MELRKAKGPRVYLRIEATKCSGRLETKVREKKSKMTPRFLV